VDRVIASNFHLLSNVLLLRFNDMAQKDKLILIDFLRLRLRLHYWPVVRFVWRKTDHYPWHLGLRARSHVYESVDSTLSADPSTGGYVWSWKCNAVSPYISSDSPSPQLYL
jgi:hypothetical protein